MNLIQKLFHKHAWKYGENKNPNTKDRYTDIRQCSLCGHMDILHGAWKGQVTDRTGRKVSVSTPEEWFPVNPGMM